MSSALVKLHSPQKSCIADNMLIKQQPFISIEEGTGPRKDIFSSIEEYLVAPGPPSGIDPLIAGKVNIHSSSSPNLQGQETYNIDLSQTIQYKPNVNSNVHFPTQSNTLHSAKQFQVVESALTLDPAAIHSVYPPPGHADYSSESKRYFTAIMLIFLDVLPHVVFNNPSLPWSMSPSPRETSAPWLGILSFTEDELTASDGYLSTNGISLPATPTFAKSISVDQLNGLIFNGATSSSMASSDANNGSQSIVQVVMIAADLFEELFRMPHSGDLTLSPFGLMTHVRSVETFGLTNRAGTDSEDFSTVIGVRTGPLDPSLQTVVHNHLISFSGLLENTNSDPMNRDPVTLISLYSWSHTCLPAAGGSLHDLLRGIGNNMQPLRSPDNLLIQASSPSQKADDWVKNRMLGGYSLLDYHTSAGAQTLAFHRGPLTPFRPATVDFPPSDYGTDLAFADTFTGALDLSFQLAWELGRLLMVNDRSTSAALMRLRRDCHCDAATAAKTTAVQNAQIHASPSEIIYIAQNDAVNALPSSLISLQALKPTDGTGFVARWGKPSSFPDPRSTFAFPTDVVQQPYAQTLQNPQASFSRALPR